MNSAVAAKAAIGALVVIICIGIFLRAGRQPPPVSQEEAAPSAEHPSAANAPEPAIRVEQVQQRLQQLRDARATRDKGAPQAPPAAPPAAAPRAPARAPQTGSASASSREVTTGASNPAAGGADESGIEDDPDDIPALTNTALRDADPERRLAAVTLLGASEDAQVLPTLTQILREDTDPEVRMAALQSLSDFTDEAPAQVVDAAAIGLSDSDPEYRLEALGVLSDIDDDRARAVMQQALTDPDEEVRSMAEGILEVDPQDQAAAAAPAPGHAPAPAPAQR